MSSDKIQEFKQLLAQNGQNVTKARLRTFELLLDGEPHAMSQLIAKSAGTVDRVSIYRNIELFEKLGVVKKVYIGWKYKIELSDLFTTHHHHLLCLGCGKTTDIEDEQHIESFIESVASEQGFSVRSHQFEIEGYCKTCSIKNER